MDGVLFLVAFLIIVSFHLKGYYTYKFLVAEEFKRPAEGLLKFSFKAEHVIHKLHSFSILPILSRASLEESRKAKSMANSCLVVFYLSIAFVVGYSFLVGRL